MDKNMKNDTEQPVKITYDSAFRTLLFTCPQLIVPVINEVFGTDYRMDESATILPNKIPYRDAEGNERVEETDSYIRIRDKQYHIEFQSRADDTMVLRMTDYDFQIALANRKLIQCVVKPLALAMGI